MTKSTEVAEKKDQLPSTVVNDSSLYAQYANAGMEEADQDSFAIPFLYMLQQQSHQVIEDDPLYIEGAKPGMIYNTVSKKVYDVKEKGISIIPVFFRRSFICWGNRQASGGGGFKGTATVEEMRDMKQDETKILEIENTLWVPDKDGKVDPEKNDYWADTRNHFVLIYDEENGETTKAIISLSSSQIKKSKEFLTNLGNQKATAPNGKSFVIPTFANVASLSNTRMADNKGNKWFGFEFTISRRLKAADEQHIFEEAAQFFEDLRGGKVDADYSKADASTSAASENFEKPVEAEKF